MSENRINSETLAAWVVESGYLDRIQQAATDSMFQLHEDWMRVLSGRVGFWPVTGVTVGPTAFPFKPLKPIGSLATILALYHWSP